MPCSVGTVFKLHTKQQLHAQFIRDLQVVISLPAKIDWQHGHGSHFVKTDQTEMTDFNSQ